ncbi:MAG: hypothetical protein DCF25_11335 [Leptolyngbya foveolarum]|uniref:histidine kinase n=1 Tax=Leptolyngbya foveolarum TaxID=47253 RepID=A0A2W4U8J8_9CYAN|nr:MAG: hypothetical protein DCF25_11335 [Leptolyngbya foveolarum]
MSAIASPEFISLCHAQLRLMTQQMAESTAALYMADIAEAAAGNDSHFVPVVSYPEPVDSWIEKFSSAPWETTARTPLALPGTVGGAPSDLWPERLPAPIEIAESGSEQPSAPTNQTNQTANQTAAQTEPVEEQLVVPLVYTDVVVGLVVAIRRDRPWKRKERSYIKTMADSLAAGCVLERRNQWLQGRITHRKGLQSRQSEIFHNLLHQFRNPLTAVNTFGKLLVKRLDPEDPNQTVATGIVRETSRLRELVTHFDEAVAIGDAALVSAAPTPVLSAGQPLLPQGDLYSTAAKADASRLDPSQSEIAPLEDANLDNSLGHALTLSRQSLNHIVDPILEVASIVAIEKGVRLKAQVSHNTPWVWGEEEALSEVVSNLVDNAIKYSPPGAQVWVQTGVSRLESQGHYQGIVVADTGPGIPAADLARLFERYYRGVQAQGKLPGTGLGLAIAQSLVKEMQGAIEVISPAVGTPWLPSTRDSASSQSGPGTVFIVWLLEAD